MTTNPTPAITLGGVGSPRMQYFAFSGAAYSPGEVGWILVVEGASPPIDPQALSVAEVLGDIEATVHDDADLTVLREVLRVRTDGMIEDLKRGKVAAPQHEGESSAPERLAVLLAELAEAFPV